jgi:predicted transcriptional regulator
MTYDQTTADLAREVADLTAKIAQCEEKLAKAEELKRLCATIVMGKDWHIMSHNEREVVRLLEEDGHLEPSKNGFVGWITEPSRAAQLKATAAHTKALEDAKRLEEAAARTSSEWRRILDLASTFRASIYETTPELRDALSVQGAALSAATPDGSGKEEGEA